MRWAEALFILSILSAQPTNSQVWTYQLTLFSIALIFLISAFIMTFNAIMASFFLTVLHVILFISSIQQLFYPIYSRKQSLSEGLHTDYLLGVSIPGQSEWGKDLRQGSIKNNSRKCIIVLVLLQDEPWRAACALN